MNTIPATTCGKLKKKLNGKKYYIFVPFFNLFFVTVQQLCTTYKETFLNHHHAVKCCCHIDSTAA